MVALTVRHVEHGIDSAHSETQNCLALQRTEMSGFLERQWRQILENERRKYIVNNVCLVMQSKVLK